MAVEPQLPIGTTESDGPTRAGTEARTTTSRDESTSALATVMRYGAVPYGYTVTIWTSGMMLTRERGLPSVAEVFLFMIGAVAGFVLLGLIAELTGGVPFEPRHGALRRTGMLHVLAIGGGLGGAALVALIRNGVAWPLGAFVATATYLALTTLELAIAKPR